MTLRRLALFMDDVPGDGNCLFEAVARQLTVIGEPCTRQEVKQRILNFMSDNSFSPVSTNLKVSKMLRENAFNSV